MQEGGDVPGRHQDIVVEKQNSVAACGLGADVVGFSKIEILIEFDQPGVMKATGIANNRFFMRPAAVIDNDDLIRDV